jgi:hypothetical protein
MTSDQGGSMEVLMAAAWYLDILDNQSTNGGGWRAPQPDDGKLARPGQPRGRHVAAAREAIIQAKADALTAAAAGRRPRQPYLAR